MKLFIAITGNICSGKSSLLSTFTKLGIKTYSCDAIVENLYADTKTLNLFKNHNLSKFIIDNKINKKLLFKDFFKDKKLKNKVESLIHPIVIAKLNLIKKKPGLKIVEVPLLFEANINNMFNNTICVYLDANTQVLRLMNKYNIDKNKAYTIINSQLNINYKVVNSDFIINNNKDLKSLENKAVEILNTIKK